jgi:two-component system OmpR family response regulator
MYASPQSHDTGQSAVSKRRTADDVYTDSCLLIEQKRYFAAVKGVPLKLTRTEFKILSCLASNIDRITRLEDLWNSAWSPAKSFNRKSIQVIMSRVRAKVVPRGLRIDSIVDVGYILSHDRCCDSELDNNKKV